MTYRAYIGEWDSKHRTTADHRGLDWNTARDALLAFATTARADNEGGCGHCYAAAVEAVDALTALPEGAEWKGDIDWDDLILTREPEGVELPPPLPSGYYRAPGGCEPKREWAEGWTEIGATEDKGSAS